MSAISQTRPGRRRARPLEEPETGNYFVAVYPPVEAWEPKGAAEFERALDHPASGEPLGIYAHLPFCRKKCDYCYYLSFTEQKPAAVNNYLK